MSPRSGRNSSRLTRPSVVAKIEDTVKCLPCCFGSEGFSIIVSTREFWKSIRSKFQDGDKDLGTT